MTDRYNIPNTPSVRVTTEFCGGGGQGSDAPAMWFTHAAPSCHLPLAGALAQHAASMAHQELAHNPGAAGGQEGPWLPQQDQRASGGS